MSFVFMLIGGAIGYQGSYFLHKNQYGKTAISMFVGAVVALPCPVFSNEDRLTTAVYSMLPATLAVAGMYCTYAWFRSRRTAAN